MAILASALSQDLPLPGVERLVRELGEKLGSNLLEPWRSRQEDLERSTRLGWLQAWPHRDNLAGWITAVGDFLRSHPNPGQWANEWPRPADFVRSLALSIPWMGRKSTERVKGWRVARWLVRGEGLESPIWPSSGRLDLKVPYPVVSVPLGWFGRLPSGWEAQTARARQDWTDRLVREVTPDDPARIWIPMEGILRRGNRDHVCVERLGACGACPLEGFCKR